MAKFTNCSLTVRPTSEFGVPLSDGYLVYAALLDRISEESPDISEFLHSPDGRLNVSGLRGPFGRADHPHRKQVQETEYEIDICVIEDEGAEAEAILRPLVFGDGRLTLGDGVVEVVSADTQSATVDDFLAEADTYVRPYVEMEFVTPTCILAGEHRSTEMFPHRSGVFTSLSRAWTSVVADDRALSLDSQTIRGETFELPDLPSLQTHNVVVNYVGESRKPIKRHGFTGTCTYSVHPEASAATSNALVALARFAEYAGVGSAVSRGCGTVSVKITDHTN